MLLLLLLVVVVVVVVVRTLCFVELFYQIYQNITVVLSGLTL